MPMTSSDGVLAPLLSSCEHATYRIAHPATFEPAPLWSAIRRGPRQKEGGREVEIESRRRNKTPREEEKTRVLPDQLVDRLLAMLELDVAAGPPASPPPPAGKEQQAAAWGILLQISMLVLAFVVGHLLRRHKFYYLPEASVSLLVDS